MGHLVIKFREISLNVEFEYTPAQLQTYDTPPFQDECDIEKITTIDSNVDISELLDLAAIKEIEEIICTKLS